MKHKLRTRHGLFDQNIAFFRMLLLYLVLMIFIAGIACIFSCRQKEAELDSQINLILSGLDREYEDITSSFWKIYMPLYEEHSTAYEPLFAYFSGKTLSQSLYKDLKYAMTQMVLRDDRVAWLAVYSPLRDSNYIFLSDARQMWTFGQDFPYLSRLSGRSMKVLGSETLPGIELKNDTFAICGSAPTTMGEGSIIAGYRISSFEKVCNGHELLLDSMRFEIISNGALVFSSTHGSEPYVMVDSPYSGTAAQSSGEQLYIRANTSGDKDSFLVFSASRKEILIYQNQLTFHILIIVLLFAVISLLLYLFTLRVITREVNVIRQGLRRISENDMSTPIEGKFIQAGLYSIAQAVNDMALQLDQTVNRAHYYQLRQKEAELSELQSKYNPHFLYNTLEMLRSRCEKAGADDVAALITDFSAIFRSLIGSHTFIHLNEELMSTRRYLSLLSARYEDQVSVRYNFSREVLHYGVIRNVFQPLIENYFQYGFTTTIEDNEILISGSLQEDGLMELSVADNGMGMTDESIAALRLKLQQAAQDSQASYGLKNLHQRLRLFYGENCGLLIDKNGTQGLKVTIIARAITCEEYETVHASVDAQTGSTSVGVSK